MFFLVVYNFHDIKYTSLLVIILHSIISLNSIIDFSINGDGIEFVTFLTREHLIVCLRLLNFYKVGKLFNQANLI